MRVSDLYIYPIKSTAALSMTALHFDELGPRFDRNWMVVDAKGMFMSQRKFPKMCLIQARVLGDTLRLKAPMQNEISLAETSSELLSVSVWGDEVLAYDCGDETAHWLSEYLQKECRLVQVGEKTQRKVDLDFAHKGELVAFADGFPSLIVSSASLNEFNSHLEMPIDMRSFRPNIVIEGSSAYAEDDWKSIRIRDLTFDLVKPCSRCIMPSINPDTATKEMAINQALLRTRRGADGKTYFGQNALHRSLGNIRVGDQVEVLD